MKFLIFLALLAFVAVVVSVCVHIVRRIRQESNDSAAFLAKFSPGIPDNTARQTYENTRKEIFTACRQAGQVGEKWDADRIDEDMHGDPANSWHRQIPEPMRVQLKTALLNRTIANFPLLANLPMELQQKAQMYQRGLLSTVQWRSILMLRNWLEEETLTIRHEAECLTEKWGQENGVFAQAAAFIKRLAEKRMGEAQEQIRKRAQVSAPDQVSAPVPA